MKLSKKWLRNWSRKTLAGMVAGSLCMLTPGLAMMEEKQEYTFDPILVTALRRESKDLTTPAAVEVLTSEKIKATGASNVLEVLKYVPGLTIETYGARGSLSGGMSGGVSIRGMGKDLGALVMLNGVPLNLNGKYELQNYPVDSIERIEIVKGAASTLHGSAALGGVINIITKKGGNNFVSTEVGSFSTMRETVNFQDGKFRFNVVNETYGSMGKIQADTFKAGKPGYNFTADSEQKLTYEFGWDFSDKLTFSYRHVDNTYQLSKRIAGTFVKSGVTYLDGDPALGNMWQQDSQDIASVKLQTGAWSHKLYYNGLVRRSRNNSAANNLTGTTGDGKLANSEGLQYMQTYGMDSQSSWKTPFGTYITGASWQKDTFESSTFVGTTKPWPNKQRDLLSLFGQVDRPLNAKTNLILGMRQDWVLNQNGLKDLSSFTPQFQLLHKLNLEQSFYLNVGKAFRAPNWTAMYSSGTLTTGNPDLDPDEGWNYEVGWKKIGKSDSFKVALFKLDFPSFHKWVRKTVGANTIYYAENTEFRNNLGIEANYERSLKNGWSYHLGAMYGSPESRTQGEDWAQSDPKLQISGGIGYKKGKWTADLSALFVGMRQDFNASSERTGPIDNSLQANLSLSYAVSPNSLISLRVENLFDRIDYTNGSAYITPPRSFFLKLTQKF